MLFSSSSFIFFFLPITLGGYYLLYRHRVLQNLWLLAVSLVFYTWGESWLVLIMLLSIGVNWALGLRAERCRSKAYPLWPILVAAAGFNLGMLFIYKYLNFVVDNLNSALLLSLELPRFSLPIGISFFTFQALSYVVDVARGRTEAQKNPLYVGLYISLFPQLVAGPIVRYQTVAHEILHRHESWVDVASGMERFVVGMIKKALLANSLGAVADSAFGFNPDWLTASYAWLGALAYSLQIFYDFSGYSDMALGLGRMFGFHFEENFDLPYMSTSVSEFWRRWHISLGSWFRDYVYFPLGGSRVSSKARLVFNLGVVWLLTGLWHGANWTFILWGVYYFVVLVIEKLSGMNTKTQQGIHALRRVYTLLAVLIGWVLFRADSLNEALRYLGIMFGANGFVFDELSGYYVRENLGVFLLAILFCAPLERRLSRWADRASWSWLAEPALLLFLFMIAASYIVKGSYNPFIYFNF